MNETLVGTLTTNFRSQTTENLLAIWNDASPEQYSEEAFEAVRRLLVERGHRVEDTSAFPAAPPAGPLAPFPAPALPAGTPAPLQYASPAPRSASVPDQFLSVCVCKCDAPVYGTTDPQATPIRGLTTGELFSIGKAVKDRGVKRVEATLLDGARGFIPETTRIFRMRAAKLQPRKTIMYSAPNTASAPMATLTSGTEVVLVDQVPSAQGKLFSEVRDQQGRTGYIDGAVKVVMTAARPNTAGRDMLVGGVICVIGVAITVGTYSAATSSSGGGTYFIAWGPAIFGAIQFFKGLSRLGEGSPAASLLERLMPQIIQEKTATRSAGPPPVVRS